MQILQGLIGMTAGILILVYRSAIKEFIGTVGFAESWFGMGGTWTFLALMGISVFIFSLLWMTGTFQDFFIQKFAPFL